MDQQAEIDTLTTKVTDVSTGLTTAVTAIQSEFASLEAEVQAGKPTSELDLTGLSAAIGGLEPVATQLEQIKPEPSQPQQANGAPAGSAPLKADGTPLDNTADPAAAQAQQADVAKEAARQQV